MRKGTPQRSLRERFEDNVCRDSPSGCWEWSGAIFKATGYGQLGVKRADGRWVPDVAHRVSYRLYVGEIPAQFVIDHLCRNRSCVNPEHLEAVPQRTNLLRGLHPSAVACRSNTCKHGHVFDEANTIVRRSNGRQKRDCRACVARRNAARYKT